MTLEAEDWQQDLKRSFDPFDLAAWLRVSANFEMT